MTEPVNQQKSFFQNVADGISDAAEGALNEVTSVIDSVKEKPLQSAGMAYLGMSPIGLIPMSLYRTYKRISVQVSDVGSMASALWRGSVRDAAKTATNLVIHKAERDTEDALTLLGIKGTGAVAKSGAAAQSGQRFLRGFFQSRSASTAARSASPKVNVADLKPAAPKMPQAAELTHPDQAITLHTQDIIGGVTSGPVAPHIPAGGEIVRGTFQSTTMVEGQLLQLGIFPNKTAGGLRVVMNHGGETRQFFVRLQGTPGRKGQAIPFGLPEKQTALSIYSSLLEKIRECGSVRDALSWLRHESTWGKSGLLTF